MSNNLKNIELPWLDSQVTAWRSRVAADRAPHALLLSGPPGVGKRSLASWLARERLALDGLCALPTFPYSIPAHPDVHWLRPADDKKFIVIEQVRALVADLSLTSHGTCGKVAVLEPANAMTTGAANSLLKTLEEPPGDALLILVADRAGRLPPTVRSRCQQLAIAIPAEPVALEWLSRARAGANGGAALKEAGGAPLAALAAAERLDQTEEMARDFGAIAERRSSPIEVAGRWAREDPEFVLEWLCREIQRCIYRAGGTAGGTARPAVADSVLRRVDRRKLFCYLDIINRLRGQPAGSFNAQLTLENLLIDWASGLRNCRPTMDP